MKPLEDARRAVMSAVVATPIETVSIWEAAGRFLSSEIVAKESVPPFENSAMDGYAVQARDVAEPGARLEVVGDLPAGVAPSMEVGPGQAVRIMTGAPMPAGADTVVRVEDTSPGESTVEVIPAVAAGTSVRPAGGDVTAGQSMFGPGTRLTAMHVGVLATLGFGHVDVHRRPRVAFMSTGDELRPVDDTAPLEPGAIRDSNRPMLNALLADAGVETVDMGIIPDDEGSLRKTLDEAASTDAIITTGGVSMGDHDVTKLVLSGDAGVEFWKVAIQPAKPFAFGHIASTIFFGLPGNPVSAMVSFEQLVRPALMAMQGARHVLRPRLLAVAGEDFTTDPEKTVFLRVMFAGSSGDGRPRVIRSGMQDSNVLSAAAAADALAVVPRGIGLVAEGEDVTIELFHSPASREYTDGD